MTCSRLRLDGKTLDGIFDLHPTSWDGLFGAVGKRGRNQPIIGQPGEFRVPKLAESRSGSLVLLIRPQNEFGQVVTSRCQHLEANQDVLLGLIGSEELQTLEWDMCDGTSRFLDVDFTAAAPIRHRPSGAREISLTFAAPYPGWQNPTPTVVSVATGPATNVNPGGTAPVDNPVLTFTAAATLTNTLTGEAVTVDPAGGGDVTVNCWTGAVTQAGVSARNRVTAMSHARILHLEPAVNNPLTATGAAVGVSYRSTWW